MKWQDTADMTCPVARTLSVIGDRWTFLVIRNAFMGMRRFEQFQSSLGMTRHVLADRLGRLVEAGILSRKPYQQKPLRHEYRLTDKGRDLHPLLASLIAWGDRWMDQGHGPVLQLQHRQCGHTFTPLMVCSECRAPLAPQDVSVAPGPGAFATARGDA